MKSWYITSENITSHIQPGTIWHFHAPLLAIDFGSMDDRSRFEQIAGNAAVRLPHLRSLQPVGNSAVSMLAAHGLNGATSTYDVIVKVTQNESSPLLLEK